jgi:hypothetical protein
MHGRNVVTDDATPARRGRRRRPRFLRGVRRIAYLLLAVIWIVALWSASDGDRSLYQAAGAALAASAVLGLVYFVILQVSTSASGSVRGFFRNLVKGRTKRHLTRLERGVQLVSWAAAGSAALLVLNFPDYEPDLTELAVALVVSVAVAVALVQLVGWVLKGFVRSR